MENNDIKKANLKAMPKFLLIVFGGVIVGVLFGLFVGTAKDVGVADKLKEAAVAFGMYGAPWCMLFLAVAVLAICVPLYIKGKKLLEGWDGEDEAVCDKAEKILSYVMWIANSAFIIAFFLLAATYCARTTADFRNIKTLATMFVSLGAFIAVILETIIFQQKAVDAAKKSNPEKTASVYDVKFHKKWLDSCDEAEKIVMGKCAYKAYSATNKACVVLAGVFAIAAILIGIGFSASLAVCIVWFVNQCVYFREMMKLSRAGNKIS